MLCCFFPLYAIAQHCRLLSILATLVSHVIIMITFRCVLYFFAGSLPFNFYDRCVFSLPVVPIARCLLRHLATGCVCVCILHVVIVRTAVGFFLLGHFFEWWLFSSAYKTISRIIFYGSTPAIVIEKFSCKEYIYFYIDYLNVFLLHTIEYNSNNMYSLQL